MARRFPYRILFLFICVQRAPNIFTNRTEKKRQSSEYKATCQIYLNMTKCDKQILYYSLQKQTKQKQTASKKDDLWKITGIYS